MEDEDSASPKKSETAYIKKYWFLIAGIVGVLSSITGALFWFLLNSQTLIANLEKLPADVSRITTKYLSWYHDDEFWTGFWSEYPEGYVDLEEMHLSRIKLGVDITSKAGEISGMIGTKEICNAFPLINLDFLFIEGKVKGKAAVITVFDHIGGKRKEFTRLRLERDGTILTVKPIGGVVDLFPQEARIANHSGDYPIVNFTDDKFDSSTYFTELCKDKRKALAKILKNNGKVRRPTGELQSSFASEEESP